MVGPRFVDKSLVLYGYGKLGHLAKEIFKELRIPIHGIVDKLTYWAENSRLDKDPLVAVCVTREPYNEIVEHIKLIGFSDIVPVWDIIESYPKVGIHNGWIVGNPCPKEDVIEINNVEHGWSDKESEDHYYAFIKWRKWHDEEGYPKPVNLESLPSTLADIRERQNPSKCIYYHYDNKDDIQIHAEGYELEHLEKMISHYQRYRPKIQVACYHSRDGLWKIEKFLMDNLPNYIWKFRLTAYMGQGAYIYGVPKERHDNILHN